MKPRLSWKCALFGLAAAQMITAQSSKIPSTRAITGPGIIPIGSPLTFGGTNAPDTYSANTTFSSTPVLVDNGAVKIWQQQVPTASNAEWDIFYMQTTNGPLAGNINANWNILMNYTLSAAVVFDAVVQQWGVNGTPVSPITNGIGSICCAALSNPILPGASYYNSGFSAPFPAGVFTNWQQVYVDPYTFVRSGGIDPSAANTFTFALLSPCNPRGLLLRRRSAPVNMGRFRHLGRGPGLRSTEAISAWARNSGPAAISMV